jgi:hypothetical protein
LIDKQGRVTLTQFVTLMRAHGMHFVEPEQK